MPPRKSNVSAVSATGDEGTPVKDRDREGISVEVRPYSLVFHTIPTQVSPIDNP